MQHAFLTVLVLELNGSLVLLWVKLPGNAVKGNINFEVKRMLIYVFRPTNCATELIFQKIAENTVLTKCMATLQSYWFHIHLQAN